MVVLYVYLGSAVLVPSKGDADVGFEAYGIAACSITLQGMEPGQLIPSGSSAASRAARMRRSFHIHFAFRSLAWPSVQQFQSALYRMLPITHAGLRGTADLSSLVLQMPMTNATQTHCAATASSCPRSRLIRFCPGIADGSRTPVFRDACNGGPIPPRACVRNLYAPSTPRGSRPRRNRGLLAGWRKIPGTVPTRRWYLHGGCRAERDAEDVVDPGFKGRHAWVGALFCGPRNGRRERNMSKKARTRSPDDSERAQELFR